MRKESCSVMVKDPLVVLLESHQEVPGKAEAFRRSPKDSSAVLVCGSPQGSGSVRGHVPWTPVGEGDQTFPGDTQPKRLACFIPNALNPSAFQNSREGYTWPGVDPGFGKSAGTAINAAWVAAHPLSVSSTSTHLGRPHRGSFRGLF